MLAKADKAKKENARGAARDKIATEVMASYGNNGKIDVEQLNTNLKEHIQGITHDEKSLENNPIRELPANVELDGFKFRIEKDGTVTDLEDTSTPEEGETAKYGSLKITCLNKTNTEELRGIKFDLIERKEWKKTNEIEINDSNSIVVDNIPVGKYELRCTTEPTNGFTARESYQNISIEGNTMTETTFEFGLFGAILPSDGTFNTVDGVSSLRIFAESEGRHLEGMQFSIYKIGILGENKKKINPYGAFEEFQQYYTDISVESTTSTFKELASQLSTKIEEDVIEPDQIQVSNSDGILVFDGRDEGVYLIMSKPFISGMYLYKSVPFFINLTNADFENDIPANIYPSISMEFNND